MDDVQLFTWDAACDARLDDDGDCHAITISGEHQSCTHFNGLPGGSIDTGTSSCMVGRVRAKATLPGAHVFVGFSTDAESFEVEAAIDPDVDYFDYDVSCRLPDELELTRIYLQFDKAGPAVADEISFGFVEIAVVPCTGDEDDCAD